ncbi:MAG: phospholipid carrier-dependent glycosyltransferase [Ardenticatenaceae bacterium]|nr:phospholipid carrier-dependent glycosyltransferase [Ardenticatenaceae bacterium]
MKQWWPLILFLFALLLRFTFRVLTHFDGLYGQDPFAYYNYALTLREALLQGQLPPPFFWPIGYPLLIVMGTFFSGSQPLAGQLASMIMGAAIAPLTYWLVLAYQPQAKIGAIIAALLAGTASQLMLSSISIMSDAAGLAWAALSALGMVYYVRRLTWPWLVWAGLALGMAILTRWVYALLVFGWGLSALLAWWQHKVSWRHVVTAVILAVLSSGLIVSSQFLGSLNQPQLAHVGDLQVVGWNPANAFQSIITNSDGTFTYERPIGLYYATPLFHPGYIFPLFTPFLLIGLWQLWQQSSRASRALLLGWAGLVYLFLAGIAWQNWRFPLAMFVPLLILVGIGADWVWQRVSTRWWRWGVTAVCAVGLMGSLSWAVRDITRFTAWKEETVATAVWVENQLPPDATLIAFGLTNTLQHYTQLETYELYGLDEAALEELFAEYESCYLLINDQNVQSQWHGKRPETNVNWIRERANMVAIGRSGYYTLYQITP